MCLYIRTNLINMSVYVVAEDEGLVIIIPLALALAIPTNRNSVLTCNLVYICLYLYNYTEYT